MDYNRQKLACILLYSNPYKNAKTEAKRPKKNMYIIIERRLIELSRVPTLVNESCKVAMDNYLAIEGLWSTF